MRTYEYDSITGLTRSHRQANQSHWFFRLLALVILLLCVAIGMVGLILPIIPGLLFLGIAALITARVFPQLAARLRQHPKLASYLDSSEGFARLSFRGKCKYVGWLTLRMLVDGLRLLHLGLTKLLIFASRNP